MVTSGLDWNARARFLARFLAQFFAGGCAVLFGAGALIELAQAQYVVRPTPPQAPVFNPSSPNVVPQPSYRPITPTTPSVGPGNPGSAPVAGLARITPRPHRRTSGVKTSSSKRHVAETRATTRRHVYRGRAVAVGPAPVSYSYYSAPFGYGYGCAWVRAWDGHWFRTSPCS
jgi:hypothetical protein